jgi:hypothetical protein
MSQLLACNAAWLETNQMTNTTYGSPYDAGVVPLLDSRHWDGGSGCTGQSPWTYTNYWWPYYPVYTTSPARPIKLKMSEVERLRKAAKDDPKLKAILNKFTEQIEIEVDFD